MFLGQLLAIGLVTLADLLYVLIALVCF